MPRSRTLVGRLEVCSARVMGAPMASRGGAITINSRCWMTWAWKNSMVKVATGDCRARSNRTSPDRNEVVRLQPQWRPRATSFDRARRYQAAVTTTTARTSEGERAELPLGQHVVGVERDVAHARHPQHRSHVRHGSSVPTRDRPAHSARRAPGGGACPRDPGTIGSTRPDLHVVAPTLHVGTRRQQHTGSNQIHIVPEGLVRIGHGQELPVGRGIGQGRPDVLVGAFGHGAVGVVHDGDPVHSEEVGGEHQRPERRRGSPGPRHCG